MTNGKSYHWLDIWASRLHDWQRQDVRGRTLYCRRQGIVENHFDIDGTDFEGRADINPRLTTEMRTSLDRNSLRKHITKVWSIFRHRHILLSARSLQAREFLPQSSGDRWLDKCFAYLVPEHEQAILEGGLSTIVFLEDHYPNVDVDHFWMHALNSSRIPDEKQYLAKLFIFPFQETESGTIRLQTYLVGGHQIADGLTIYRWTTDFIRMLNYTNQQLDQEAKLVCSPDATLQRLPPAQESLYPPQTANQARWRWQWLITRLLRHVRTPVPSSFQNPLRRDEPLDHAVDLPHTYAKVLRYSPKPPLNSYTVGLQISVRATHNLIRLCREAGISRGSGSFVLVALVMMRLEEKYRPDISLPDRLPFVGSFPVNPRPFLSGAPTTGKEDSLMLAFSDGVTLPFLPSSCDLQTSFKVLGRLAHRQLNRYQKKKRSAAEVLKLGSHSPQQLLPDLYIGTIGRLENRCRPERRLGFDPQGQYPAQHGKTLATCGISSIGDISGLVSRGVYDVNVDSQRPVVADFRDLKNAVRAREGEFLVGSAGSKDHQGFMVSYDGSAIDPDKVVEWKAMLLDLLDYDVKHQTRSAQEPRNKTTTMPKL